MSHQPVSAPGLRTSRRPATAALEHALIEWIGQHGAWRGVLDRDTALFAEGVLDSLRLAELLLHLEWLLGRALRVEDLRPECFRSVATIAAQFAMEEAA
jgi:acyl carrier protein